MLVSLLMITLGWSKVENLSCVWTRLVLKVRSPNWVSMKFNNIELIFYLFELNEYFWKINFDLNLNIKITNS